MQNLHYGGPPFRRPLPQNRSKFRTSKKSPKSAQKVPKVLPKGYPKSSKSAKSAPLEGFWKMSPKKLRKNVESDPRRPSKWRYRLRGSAILTIPPDPLKVTKITQKRAPFWYLFGTKPAKSPSTGISKNTSKSDGRKYAKVIKNPSKRG